MALTQIKTAGIAADAVTGAKIADDAVDSEHYTDGSIDNAHVADDQINSEHYAAGSIDTEHYAANSVDLAAMAGIARGKLIVGNASGDPAYLAAGSNDQVLTMDANGDVGWEAAAAGGAALTGSTNNTVCTVTGANAIAGEANLTFDGSTLDIDNGGELLRLGGNANSSGRTNNTAKQARIVTPHHENAEEPMAVLQTVSDGTDTMISYGGGWSGANAVTVHRFYTATGDTTTTGTEQWRVNPSGNLQAMVAGNGIDFSATADAGGMSNELLDDYEEGTWTPALTYGGNAVGLNTPVGTYVKVGNLICCRCRCHTTDNPAGNNVNISGLPYTSSNPANDGNAITGAVYMETCASGITTGHPMAFGFDNSTNFDIRMSGTTGGGTSQVSDAAGTGTSYMTTITYQTS